MRVLLDVTVVPILHVQREDSHSTKTYKQDFPGRNMHLPAIALFCLVVPREPNLKQTHMNNGSPPPIPDSPLVSLCFVVLVLMC